MSRDYIRMRSTAERERRLARAHEVLPEVDSDSAIVDAGLEALVQLDSILDDEMDAMTDRASELSGEAFDVSVYPKRRRSGSE